MMRTTFVNLIYKKKLLLVQIKEQKCVCVSESFRLLITEMNHGDKKIFRTILTCLYSFCNVIAFCAVL